MALNQTLFTKEHLSYLNQQLNDLSPEKIIEWSITTLPNLYQTTAFGLTGLVITDIISKYNKSDKHPIDLIFIDTLYHFEETLQLVNKVKQKYNATINIYKPNKVNNRSDFESKYGAQLWKSNEDQYDYLVKVEPAHRAYNELNVSAVFTGRRRSQHGQRSSIPILELDTTGLLKINPLANWTFSQVEEYVKRNNVPYNPLLDQGYLSIGDYHSTTPSKDKNDERSGRWANQTKTECGLHKDYFKLKLAATATTTSQTVTLN
ncbi:putative phosphoadenosine phosphosulfate reductase [Neoconidiobolus thromboides FSU 785]|nr:putative phosphoadenosine phosphosulfate reductase [Neoconidiobolus thromboides FSU 785]